MLVVRYFFKLVERTFSVEVRLKIARLLKLGLLLGGLRGEDELILALWLSDLQIDQVSRAGGVLWRLLRT